MRNKKNYRVFIIAELSANHNNDFQLAKKTIEAMKKSGADAVKFQTYTADSLSLDCDNKYFSPIKDGLGKGQRPYDIFEVTSMPWDWQLKLSKYAEEIGLKWFSSPFDFKAIDFLESINCPMYKIGSFEIVDIPLIRYAAQKKKPMILSTGIADFQDIKLAIDTCRAEGNHDISVLKCTSAYPAPFEEVNLLTIPDMKETFKINVGLSDHTLGSVVPLGAVALGALIVEKHFILSRKLGGYDSIFSMEPQEFKYMVDSIRNLEKALGEIKYQLTETTRQSRKRAKSLFVVKDIRKGEVFSEENVKSIRPAYGLSPKYLNLVLGKKAKEDIKKGTPLSWDLVTIDKEY